jgi:hypothetical protein
VLRVFAWKLCAFPVLSNRITLGFSVFRPPLDARLKAITPDRLQP